MNLAYPPSDTRCQVEQLKAENRAADDMSNKQLLGFTDILKTLL